MAYNYVVTAHKATAVNASATGYFLLPGRMNVVVARNNQLEIYVVDDVGFHSLKSITILGEISQLKIFRHKNDQTDKIFVLTSCFNAMIIEAQFTDPRNTDTMSPIKLVCDLTANVADHIGRVSETGIIGIVDPLARMIGLRIYDAMFKVIPLHKGMEEIKHFNIRLDELNIVDISFLSGFSQPTVMLIYQDAVGRHARVYDISIANKEFNNRNWSQENVENESTMIIPVCEPMCGALIIGQETISYLCGDENYLTIGPPAIQQSTLCCFTPVDKDGSRYLLGDISGRLFMLILEIENNGQSPSAGPGPGGDCANASFNSASSSQATASTSGTGAAATTSSTAAGDAGQKKLTKKCRKRERERSKPVPCVSKSGLQVVNMQLEYLGDVNIPDSVTYLDNGVAFIGSRLADSQLIKLHTDENPQSGTFVEVLYTFPNLGPIVDMCIVDLEKQGQGQLITCSGAFKDGSLRIIRNGIGINESITIDLPLIKGIWALKINSEIDNYLVLSFINETRVLKIGGQEEVEVEEMTDEGFDYDKDTYYAGNVSFDQIVQVTTTNIYLLKESTRQRVFTWSAPPDIKLFLATCNSSHLMIASGCKLFYFEIQANNLKLLSERTMEHEIACIDMSPLGKETKCCAVGLWSSESVHLISLPSLQTLVKESIDVELLPRDILQMKFDDTNYLLITIGDGTLYYYKMNDDCTKLFKRKRVVLGTQPISLRCLAVEGKPNSVFACSDRPTVIYSSNNKIVFSNVNLKSVNLMCSLNSQVFKNSLIMVNDRGFTIGQIDEMQKLHIRTIPMGETVRRINYQEANEIFGVLTVRQEYRDASRNKGKPVSKSSNNVTIASTSQTNPSNIPHSTDSDEVEIHSLVVLNQNTFEVKAIYQFMLFEFANSMCVFTSKAGVEHFVVGTAYMNDEDAEPQRGRIIILTYEKDTEKIVQECFVEVTGSVYTVNILNGMIMSTVNSTIQVFELVMDRDKELRRVVSAFNNIISLYSKVHGDHMVVGDLMRSITLLKYVAVDRDIHEVAKDFNSNWMTALEILDENTFLGSENSLNLFCCTKKPSNSDDSSILTESGHFHIGEFINVFLKGSLIMQSHIDRSFPTIGSTLFGSLSGYIGFSTGLNEEMYMLLLALQVSIEKNIRQFGNIRLSSYRLFKNEHRRVEMNGFIDGDYVEAFLDFSVEEQTKIVNDIRGYSEDKKPTVNEIVKIIEELSRIH